MQAPQGSPTEPTATTDPTGAAELIENLDAVWQWCRQHSRDVHLAEDVFQETALAALRHLPQLRDKARIRGWLVRIAQRRMADELRRRKPELLLTEDPPAPERSERARTPAEIKRARLVRRLLRKLPDFLRSPLRLHYLQGRSVREVASYLNTTVNGVKARLYRARELARRKEKPP